MARGPTPTTSTEHPDGSLLVERRKRGYTREAAIRPNKPTPFATVCRTISDFSIGRGNFLIKLTAQPLSSTLCRPKTSGSAHLRKLEKQLEPKPEENEGHFSRARSSNESVFPVRIEFY
jgi:hypothetical protein